MLMFGPACVLSTLCDCHSSVLLTVCAVGTCCTLQVYKNFVEAVDAVDNGVNQYDAEGPPKCVGGCGVCIYLLEAVASVGSRLQDNALRSPWYRRPSTLDAPVLITGWLAGWIWELSPIQLDHQLMCTWVGCRYIVNTTLGARVARLNPSWNQPYTDDTLMAGFLKAVELTGEHLQQQAAVCTCCWLQLTHVT